ncbi:RAI1 like PD-XK nuclease-domain-containing protein [Mycena floridula]|nr:RAI1 like PD-XK nuclease-domain-containing protein [Mycena floridula]
MSKQKLEELKVNDEGSKPRLEPSLPYPDLSQPSAKVTPFQQPSPIISFSYTPSRVLEFTDSALKYYVEPPIGAKLGYGYDRWIRRPEEKGRLDGLVKALSEAQRRGTSKVNLSDIGVVSWRGVMTRILTAPYEDRDGWELNVMFINGTMYFEEHLSEEKLQDKNNVEPRHRLQMYYGYSFESYCTSTTPTRPSPDRQSKDPPGWGGDVDTNVQWCSVVRTKLGDIRMVIGGEVDCVQKDSKGRDSLVELKTSLVIRNAYNETKFEKKLLKFYFQSFLLGVPDILVGFRTPGGDVKTLQMFKTIGIPRLVRGKPDSWDPSVCLDWGHRFMVFLKGVICDRETPDDTVWRVKFVPKSGVTVERLSEEDTVTAVVGGENRVGFLPRWYWDELRLNSAKPGQEDEKKITSFSLNPVPSIAAGWKI